MKKKIRVAAAIIENHNSEILCALRSPDMSMPNMWEFPGGKIEKNENIYTAVEREIDEELNCKVKTEPIVYESNHEYDTFYIQLYGIKCKIIEGTPRMSEHSKFIWLKRENLSSLVWAPADIPIVEKLIAERQSTWIVRLPFR